MESLDTSTIMSTDIWLKNCQKLKKEKETRKCYKYDKVS